MALGEAVTVRTSDPRHIAAARLVRPGVSTRVTDTDQRLIALDITRGPDSIGFTVPDNPALVLPGAYMLFLLSDKGVPSVAGWVHVVR